MVTALERERTAEELQAEIEGLQEFLDSSPARPYVNLIKKSGTHKGSIPDLTIAQFRELTGREPRKASLTKDGKHIRYDDALDEIADQLGYTSVDSFTTDIQRARLTMGQIDHYKKKLHRLQPKSTQEKQPLIEIKTGPRKVKIKPEHEEDAMATFNLWEEEPEQKPELVKVEPQPEPVLVGAVRLEAESAPKAQEIGTEEIKRGTGPITMGDLSRIKMKGGKLILEEPGEEKPTRGTVSKVAAQPKPVIVKQEKPKRKVKISEQKGAAGQLHRTLFHPPAAAHRPKMRVWENVFFNPTAKSKRRHPRKRVLQSQW